MSFFYSQKLLSVVVLKVSNFTDKSNKVNNVCNNYVTLKVFVINNLTLIYYSHSIVPGGFDVISYVTRFIPSTSLMMRVAVSPRNSCEKG